MPGSESTRNTTANGGGLIRKSKTGRTALKTKGRNAEKFRTFLAETTASCKVKVENQKWGKRKVAGYLISEGVILTESQAQSCCEAFLYDTEDERLFYKSTDLYYVQRRRVSRDQLITFLTEEHNRDHRQSRGLLQLAPHILLLRSIM